jgi:hypothetical protein
MAHIRNDGYIHSLIMIRKYPQADELSSLLYFFVGYELNREEDAKFIIKSITDKQQSVMNLVFISKSDIYKYRKVCKPKTRLY